MVCLDLLGASTDRIRAERLASGEVRWSAPRSEWVDRREGISLVADEVRFDDSLSRATTGSPPPELSKCFESR